MYSIAKSYQIGFFGPSTSAVIMLYGSYHAKTKHTITASQWKISKKMPTHKLHRVPHPNPNFLCTYHEREKSALGCGTLYSRPKTHTGAKVSP